MRIIAGEYKGRTIKTGSGPGYRPATGKVRESLFSMLESRGLPWNQTNVLDVYAGSGALGLESLSRGAKSALFVDKSVKACELIRENLAMLGIKQTTAKVLRTDAGLFLKKPASESFGLVFIDPPYGRGLALSDINSLLDSSRLSENGLLCAEIETELVFDARFHPGLNVVRDKKFGQTRIIIWVKETTADEAAC